MPPATSTCSLSSPSAFHRKRRSLISANITDTYQPSRPSISLTTGFAHGQTPDSTSVTLRLTRAELQTLRDLVKSYQGPILADSVRASLIRKLDAAWDDLKDTEDDAVVQQRVNGQQVCFEIILVLSNLR